MVVYLVADPVEGGLFVGLEVEFSAGEEEPLLLVGDALLAQADLGRNEEAEDQLVLLEDGAAADREDVVGDLRL